MSLVRLLSLAVLLTLAACAAPPGAGVGASSPLIDEPVAPFPYNSRFCP